MSLRCSLLHLRLACSAGGISCGVRCRLSARRSGAVRFCADQVLSARCAAVRALAAKLLQDDALTAKVAAQPGALELLEGRPVPAQAAAEADENVQVPEYAQRKIYFMQNLVPFIGFGFFDNVIMLIAGDLIDAKLGVAFGISTLAAAAIGNTISDVFGLWVSGFIETAGVWLGFPEHSMSSQQLKLLPMRILRNTAMVLGIVIGCILGMAPLAYPKEWRLWEARPEAGAEDNKTSSTISCTPPDM